MKLSFHALGKVPFINIKLKSLIKGSSNNGIPYLIISFETKSMAADLPFFRVFIAFKISSYLISTLTHHLSYLHLVNFLNALAFE
jgi:hypothetical protein